MEHLSQYSDSSSEESEDNEMNRNEVQLATSIESKRNSDIGDKASNQSLVQASVSDQERGDRPVEPSIDTSEVVIAGRVKRFVNPWSDKDSDCDQDSSSEDPDADDRTVTKEQRTTNSTPSALDILNIDTFAVNLFANLPAKRFTINPFSKIVDDGKKRSMSNLAGTKFEAPKDNKNDSTLNKPKITSAMQSVTSFPIADAKLKALESSHLGRTQAQTQSSSSKESAKDRVKRQRLAGQSGIGSDFKTWRTDEEMTLRQQFDS
jgi:hypothetical protein